MLRHAQAEGAAESTLGCAGPTLTRDGQAEALAIRSAFRRVNARAGTVLVSPLCRARQTARLAFQERAKTTPVLAPLGNETQNAEQRRLRTLRRLLASTPRPGTISVLISHSDVIDALTRRSIGEADALVIRPRPGGRFEILGRISSDEWKALR